MKQFCDIFMDLEMAYVKADRKTFGEVLKIYSAGK